MLMLSFARLGWGRCGLACEGAVKGFQRVVPACAGRQIAGNGVALIALQSARRRFVYGLKIVLEP